MRDPFVGVVDAALVRTSAVNPGLSLRTAVIRKSRQRQSRVPMRRPTQSEREFNLTWKCKISPDGGSYTSTIVLRAGTS